MIESGEYFRAGVGAILMNEAAQILALERADVPGAWQMPQGGLLVGEEPLEAVLREVGEETGIVETDIDLLAAFPEPLAYELPHQMRSAKTGRGQVQYWFLFKYKGDQSALRLPTGGEFRNWHWRSFERVTDEAVAFRKPLYRRLLAEFRSYLTAQ
jgi:putative (di)nucleoside polyphosphate hydrolase